MVPQARNDGVRHARLGSVGTDPERRGRAGAVVPDAGDERMINAWVCNKAACVPLKCMVF